MRPAPRPSPRFRGAPPGGRAPRPRLFPLLLLAALAAGVILALLPAATEAAPASVRSLSASPAKVAAAGGQTTIRVTVAWNAAGESNPRVALASTLGAFGSAGGPSRVSVALHAQGDGTAVATATLVGDGRLGAAAVTARAGASVRSTTVTFVGAPATVVFKTPSADAVLDAAAAPRLIVQVRDSAGVEVSGASVTFTADAGRLLASSTPPADDTPAVAVATVRSDSRGKASAFLHADPGAVRVRAAAGAAAASLALTLHGPPAQLELTALTRRVNLGDTPFAAPPGTLVAVLFDAGGRPVPRVPVRFQADVEGVTVVQSGEGESGVTGASGRAAAHVSAADAAEAGAVTIAAWAGALSASATIRIVGPATDLRLVVSPRDADGAYRVVALVTDAGGRAVPSGYQVRFSAVGATPSAMPAFDPVTAETVNGLAFTRFTLEGDSLAGVRVRAQVSDIEMDVRDSAPLPGTDAASIALAEGLNLITWPGPPLPASAAVAAIAEQVTSLWRYDETDGWQGYFPGAVVGADFELAAGDLLAVTTSAAVVWTIPEGAAAETG